MIIEGSGVCHRPASVNDLGFLKTIDRFGEGVVVGIADAAHRRFDAGLG
jgi:hypothetical protein